MNLEEVDKWLDEEFGVSYTRLEELHDFVLEQGLKKEEKLQKQLEAYENMRKEAIKFIRDRTRLIKIINKIDEFELDLYLKENEINELLNILNKVGGSDE